QHAHPAEEARDRVCRQGTLLEPLRGLRLVDVDFDGIGSRVVMTERVERPAVPGVPAVRDDESVRGLLRRTDAREADVNCHGLNVPPKFVLTTPSGEA